MTKFQYIDANGQKRGPYTPQQLKALAMQGVINPQTPMETDSGHKGQAGQIPGLFAVPQQSSKTFIDENTFTAMVQEAIVQKDVDQVAHLTPQAPNRTYSRRAISYSYKDESTGGIFSWLFDFAFHDLRLHIVNLWACRILYVLCFIAAILWILWTVIWFIVMTHDFGLPRGLEAIYVYSFFILSWLAAPLYIFVSRLFFEWYIIIFDWIVETTKAARIYSENNEE